MIEREGREDAVPNSNSADSSTLPSKGSAAQECCSVCEAPLDHLWLLCGGSFAFCLLHGHWWRLHLVVVSRRQSTRSGLIGGHEQPLEDENPSG